jgi:hypothetical protein
MRHSGNSADRRRSRREAKRLAAEQASRKVETPTPQIDRKVKETTPQTDRKVEPTTPQTDRKTELTAPQPDRKTELRIDGSLTVVLALFPFGSDTHARFRSLAMHQGRCGSLKPSRIWPLSMPANAR